MAYYRRYNSEYDRARRHAETLYKIRQDAKRERTKFGKFIDLLWALAGLVVMLFLWPLVVLHLTARGIEKLWRKAVYV